jgi:hypothetical protein
MAESLYDVIKSQKCLSHCRKMTESLYRAMKSQKCMTKSKND